MAIIVVNLLARLELAKLLASGNVLGVGLKTFLRILR
jgi:hypothetical protein